MKKYGFKFYQNNQAYITFVLSFVDLFKISKVQVYNDQTGEGYQRKPNETHINKIKKYILDSHEFKLPTSIILGVDKKELEKHLTPTNDSNMFEIDFDSINSHIFNIVDGQHRLLGLHRAFEKADKEKRLMIKNFELNSVCVLTEEGSRSVELSIFVDINSKSKRVSTDLAILADFSYKIKEKNFEKDLNNIAGYISLIISRDLNENKEQNIWHNAIKFNVHSDTKIGIISVSAFKKSLEGIVKVLLTQMDFKQTVSNLSEKELIDFCFLKGREFSTIIENIWNEVVSSKWASCFKEDKVINDLDEIVKKYYLNNYYLQRSPGVFSIHSLFEECIRENNNQISEAIKGFKVIIEKSRLNSESWVKGGEFSGLNSQSGFNKIKEKIKIH
jgi:DGQHR domain-containing protein